MARKIVIKKHHKIGAGIIVGLTIVILILAFLVNHYWSPILAKKVRSVVLESSDSLYRADFSSAELHIIRGQIIFYNITLSPDTAVYNRRVKQHLAPNNLVSLHVKRLILNHIHPFTLYFKHRLDIGQVILSAPELDDSYQLNHTKDTVIKDRRTVWQKMSKSLHSVHIGQIFLNDVQLRYKDYSGHKVAISELKEMNLSASDLLIDSATQTDRSRVLYCKEIVTELNNYKGTSPSGLYSYKINHLKLSTLTSQVDIEGLRLAPINKDKFFDKTLKDRFDVYLDSVQLNHFDYLGYHKYRTVNTSCLYIKKGSFSLFNNPNKLKKPGVDKIRSFPSIALSQLATDIRIDTLLVRHFNVAYSEYNKKSYQAGTITFNNTHGRFLNVTNNKAALLKNNICTAQLNTMFLNKGELNVSFTFDLTAKDVAYSYKGSLGPMDLEDVNTATMPFAMVKITAGTLKRLDFDINANSAINKGKLTLLYNNLKVKLLSPDTNMDGFKGKLIASLYTNLFILKHNNPDKEGEAPRSFFINYVRPKESPFFKTVWNTLLVGIKPSAGLDDKKMQTIQAQLTTHQLDKQNRLKKRAERKQRRAEKKRQKELEKTQKQGK
jgi:hypothetical protein